MPTCIALYILYTKICACICLYHLQQGDRYSKYTRTISGVTTPEREEEDILDAPFTKEEIIFQLGRLPGKSAPD